MRERGLPPPRLPTFRPIYRRYPHGPNGDRWRRIVADSGITLQQVAEARQQWIAGADGQLVETAETVADAVAALSDAERQTIPLTDEEWQLAMDGRAANYRLNTPAILRSL